MSERVPTAHAPGAGETRWPAAPWLMTLLGPDFTRGWVKPSTTLPKLELERADGPPLTFLIGTPDHLQSQWPFVSPEFTIGYVGAFPDAEERCRMLGDRLAPHAHAVRTWIQAVRWASAPTSGAASPQDVPQSALDIAHLLAWSRGATPDGRLVEVARRVLAREHEDSMRVCAAFLLLAAGEYDDAFRIAARPVEPSEHPNPALRLLRAIVASMRGQDDAALRDAEMLLEDAPRSSTTATVASMLQTQGRHAEAVSYLERVVHDLPLEERHHAQVLLAAARRAAGDPAAAIAAMPTGLACSDPALYAHEAQVWVEIGRFDEATRCLRAALSLDPGHAGALLGLARIHLWQGEPVRARELARAFAAKPEGMRILAGAAVLDGDLATASTILEALLAADPADREGRRWSAECHLRAGRWRAADRDLRWTEHQLHTVDAVLKAISLLSRPAVRHPAAWLATRSSTLLDGFFHEQLPLLCTRAELEAADSAAGLTALLWRVLRRFGGNRTDTLTIVERDAQGTVSLLRAPPAESGRLASIRNLRRLALADVTQVLAGFDELELRFPKSPHPMVYRGELRLWLGDAEGALDDFRRSRERGVCRWSYVGAAATLMFLGRPRQAWLVDRIGALRFKRLPTATTHVYRGELARRRGALRLARRELLIATDNTPARVGAWVNLALVEQQLGNSAAFDAALRRLEQIAPAILWEAHCALGLPPSTRLDAATAAPVLEKALVLMSGNRSSTQYTLVVDGRLVVIPPAATWSVFASSVASILAPTLTAALFARAQQSAIRASEIQRSAAGTAEPSGTSAAGST